MKAQSARLVAERAGTRLVIAGRSQPSCGDVMTNPQSPQLFHGIESAPCGHVSCEFPRCRPWIQGGGARIKFAGICHEQTL